MANETVNLGWLKDYNDTKFAPKTTLNSVLTANANKNEVVMTGTLGKDCLTTIAATDANTASTIVKRDSQGKFYGTLIGEFVGQDNDVQGSTFTLTTAPSQTCGIIYLGGIQSGTTDLFPTSNNSNSILTLNRHIKNNSNYTYDSQVGFSSNGNIYYRYVNGAGTLNGSGATGPSNWKKVLLVDANCNLTFSANTIDGYSGDQISRNVCPVSWHKGRDSALIRTTGTLHSSGYHAILSAKAASGDWTLGTYQENLYFVYTTDTNYSTNNNDTHHDVYLTNSGQLYGACWNDYAEFRQSNITEPGRCVKEIGDDTLILTTQRLERGCEIVSDTFGFAIGQIDECQTPIAASGRVLAYPYEDREEFRKHIGWPVCSGPDGTVSIMTEEEEEKYPSRIIGTISAVPDYETWGTGNVKVNGRVWIRIR